MRRARVQASKGSCGALAPLLRAALPPCSRLSVTLGVAVLVFWAQQDQGPAAPGGDARAGLLLPGLHLLLLRRLLGVHAQRQPQQQRARSPPERRGAQTAPSSALPPGRRSTRRRWRRRSRASASASALVIVVVVGAGGGDAARGCRAAGARQRPGGAHLAQPQGQRVRAQGTCLLSRVLPAHWPAAQPH